MLAARPRIFRALAGAAPSTLRPFSSKSNDAQGTNPKSTLKERIVSVDRSGLKQPHLHSLLKDNAHVKTVAKKAKENELTRLLHALIAMRGPITVAEFMRHALSHQQHGYYMKRDVFGTQGDFTTAPEISQMFGELIGIWCIATWQQMGSPSHIKIVEMGPGRGSLMEDFVRTAKQFPAFYAALEIHMVEISPALRQIQQTKLGAVQTNDDDASWRLSSTGPSIAWHEDLAQVPEGPTLFIAQELFDALPVHQFEYTDKGWVERLVDIDESPVSDDHFCFVLSPGPTPATRVYIGKEKIVTPDAQLMKNMPQNASPQDILANLNAAAVIAEKLEKEEKEEAPAPVLSANVQVGDRIEICPLGIALIQDMAKRIGAHSGAALVVDYGRDHPSEVSLRGIQNHQFVSVLREPGDVDLSIDVDFSTLKRYATEGGDVRAYGPVGQGQFLTEMGIEHRMAALFQNSSEETQEAIYKAYERLVDPNQMGSIFKAMALVSGKVTGEPVGFGQQKRSKRQPPPLQRIPLTMLLPSTPDSLFIAGGIILAATAYMFSFANTTEPPQPTPYAVADASNPKPGHGATYTVTGATISPPACTDMLAYLQRSVARTPSNDFLGYRPKDANGQVGPYAWITYDQVYRRIQSLAAAMLRLDMLAPTPDGGERILGIFMKNRPEWLIAQYAAMYAGGFAVALYDTLGDAATPYILNQTQLSTIVCTIAELPKVIHAKASCPFLKHIVLCDVETKPEMMDNVAGLTLWTMADLETIVQDHPVEATTPQPDDIYCLIYTSGTTGEPKGVPIRHTNIVHAIETAKDRMGLHNPVYQSDAVHFSYLPLAHSIEHLSATSMVSVGARIAFYQGDTAKILDDLVLVRPTFFGVVPRLLNKIYDKVVYGTQAAGGFKAWLFQYALDTKLVNLKLGIKHHALFDALIFSNIQKKVGLDRCFTVITGSAPLADDVMDFFRVLFDCSIVEGYGLSEMTGIAVMNLPSETTAGNVGPPLHSVETKLVSVPDMGYDIEDVAHGEGDQRVAVRGRGEVCFRGPQVISGYYKNPEATAAAIDTDGWLHTGDIGVWLPDGRLKIVDRVKNIFKLSQGEYVAPERIENILGTSTYVDQCFVYGDSLHSVLVAVVVPAEAPTTALAARMNVPGTFHEVCQHPKIVAALLDECTAVSKSSKLFGFETIKAIKLEADVFSVENNLMTPTFKLKRHECKKKFADAIDALYEQCGDLVAGCNLEVV
ncbi:Aste57867_24162 [Aphanomyces stellatus]|uniref:type II protein arginine methyltransferase n=1 Tax=Aphanomyces stellatus TaxID=120398 RepID=A0A485LPR8_9STRA|nr:hypothetical protein As57867_024088 [Aphanomyces stellatus]VFU00804.1 Aste57867_24162 [Aphanomyces stellatus]